MSNKDEPVICPNCNFPATRNYCAECGQPVHLHKETFWGLIWHFIGHYFHYDSMFFKTMKALWFSPGKLTTAYWNKQRARYIPPISLYIFISAVYFLISFNIDDNSIEVKRGHKMNNGITLNGSNHKAEVVFGADSTNELRGVGDSINEAIEQAKLIPGKDTVEGGGSLARYVNNKAKKIKVEHGDIVPFFEEKFGHNLPKLFFFMIPVMAFLLKIFYIRRKDIFFVDHAIFAIHYQAFWFSIFWLKFIDFIPGLDVVLAIVYFIYMVKALRIVYGSSRRKAIVYTISIAFWYAFFLGLLCLLELALIFYMA